LALVVTRLAPADLIGAASVLRVRVQNERNARSRAGPPIFVEVCSYLI
jgi:hypothetical protein